jgi:biotin-(acetyl-CoA carboxylase) ligase
MGLKSTHQMLDKDPSDAARASGVYIVGADKQASGIGRD